MKKNLLSDKDQMTLFVAISNWGSWMQKSLCAPSRPDQGSSY